MNYRSRTEIVSMILDAVNGGAAKTKIMCIAFKLQSVKGLSSILIGNNLIECLEGTQFQTTEKELNLLKINNEMAELLHNTIGNEDELI